MFKIKIISISNLILFFLLLFNNHLSFCQINSNLITIKSAENLGNLLETYYYLFKASTKGSDSAPHLSLDKLSSNNNYLFKLKTYNRIHIDYQHQRREKDPMHYFTILELEFKHIHDIPFSDNNLIQLYPKCSGTLNIKKSDKPLIFPLWNFKELLHFQDINWKHREYIKWYAIRFKNQIFVLYTLPVMWMEDINFTANILYNYLSLRQITDMPEFILNINEANKNSPIIHDTIYNLQNMLKKCGFNPGSIDGRFGIKTKKCLSNLLLKLGLITESKKHISFMEICNALEHFQKQSGIIVTKNIEKQTINALAKSCFDKQ